ncbi:hypothetical protein E2986_11022 [Frieseomelitta varia]|uniref:Uncharacterized protein n=1 Tax=Frieseomelitta varia TaxID=561572 RepID=A0A833RY61_9HYME|nr:hypothetical protein E2986_11022 [Frieseomelitta varia]
MIVTYDLKKKTYVQYMPRVVMVPVSSTVIPLSVYKTEYGLGFISKDKKQSSFKPEDGVKLITKEPRIENVKVQMQAKYRPTFTHTAK